jgi:hypothetical protein
MKWNVGGFDRTLRFTAGFAILVLGVLFQSWWGLLGLIPIATAAIGWCPAYVPFGISTVQSRKGARKPRS